MIGLPVILNSKKIGHVLRGVLSTDGQFLCGIVVRSNLYGARFLSADALSILGNFSVISKNKPTRCPKNASFQLTHVLDTEGTRLGIVTDAFLNGENKRVIALQISLGPLDDILTGRFYTFTYSVTNVTNDCGVVTIK